MTTSVGVLRPPDGAESAWGRQDEFLERAREIAGGLRQTMRRARDGSVTWLRPDRADPSSLIAAGPHLYDGLAGIAVFFAALGRVGGEATDRELSLEIVAPLRRLLARLVAEPERAREMSLGIGGLIGVNSFAYSLFTLGRVLEQPELVAEARRVCGLLTRRHVAADRKLDVVSGAAGAVLVLLALDSYRGNRPTRDDRILLDLADLCADHLLEHRIDRPDGTTAWETNPQYPPLTGFGHGTTGIACALIKLHARGGRRELLDAATRAWAFERSTFDEEHGNWIDRTSPELRFLNQWCFGAPGIALGRLTTLHLLAGDEVDGEIRTAVRHTAARTVSRLDHICCGSMGRVDVLLYAAEKLAEPAFAHAASGLARRTLAQASARGRLLGLVKSRHRDPSLFSGEAGVGYTLLRLVCPSELPCLLALE